MLLNLDGCHVNSDECVCDPTIEELYSWPENRVKVLVIHDKWGPIEVNTRQEFQALKEGLDSLLREMVFIDIDLKYAKELLHGAVSA